MEFSETDRAGSWAPEACTLTVAERPRRAAEFDGLFAVNVKAPFFVVREGLTNAGKYAGATTYVVRLVVTAKGTMPISPSNATYSATSATAISNGPETVPPGRSSLMPTSCFTVAEALPTASTMHLL